MFTPKLEYSKSLVNRRINKLFVQETSNKFQKNETPEPLAGRGILLVSSKMIWWCILTYLYSFSSSAYFSLYSILEALLIITLLFIDYYRVVLTVISSVNVAVGWTTGSDCSGSCFVWTLQATTNNNNKKQSEATVTSSPLSLGACAWGVGLFHVMKRDTVCPPPHRVFFWYSCIPVRWWVCK